MSLAKFRKILKGNKPVPKPIEKPQDENQNKDGN